MTSYADFVRAKVRFDAAYGHEIDDAEIHPALKPHQRAIVRWAVNGGRRALFESFGLGKTVQELEIVRLTLAHAGGARGLIVLPLGVRQEFMHDAAMERPLQQESRLMKTTFDISSPIRRAVMAW